MKVVPGESTAKSGVLVHSGSKMQYRNQLGPKSNLIFFFLFFSLWEKKVSESIRSCIGLVDLQVHSVAYRCNSNRRPAKLLSSIIQIIQPFMRTWAYRYQVGLTFSLVLFSQEGNINDSPWEEVWSAGMPVLRASVLVSERISPGETIMQEISILCGRPIRL